MKEPALVFLALATVLVFTGCSAGGEETTPALPSIFPVSEVTAESSVDEVMERQWLSLQASEAMTKRLKELTAEKGLPTPGYSTWNDWPDFFAGCVIGRDGGLVVCVTESNDEIYELLSEACPDYDFTVRVVQYSGAELERLYNEALRRREELKLIGVTFSTPYNAVLVTLAEDTEENRRMVAEALDSDAVVFELPDPIGGQASEPERAYPAAYTERAGNYYYIDAETLLLTAGNPTRGFKNQVLCQTPIGFVSHMAVGSRRLYMTVVSGPDASRRCLSVPLSGGGIREEKGVSDFALHGDSLFYYERNAYNSITLLSRPAESGDEPSVLGSVRWDESREFHTLLFFGEDGLVFREGDGGDYKYFPYAR